MSPEMRRRPAAVAVLAAALTTGLASSASANPPTPVEAAIYNFDPGVACTFPLTVSATSGLLRSNEFNNGPKGTVRQILVGTGVSYTFENASTGARITIKAAGSAIHTSVVDGVQTVDLNGQNIVIFFPSDVPAGPSTTLYQGRVVYTVDLATGISTLVSTTDKGLNICSTLT